MSSRSPISRSAPMRGAGSASKESPSRPSPISFDGSQNSAPGPASCDTLHRRCHEVAPLRLVVYLTNLTPKERPRRHTTWHWRALLASRENARRTRPDSTLESATVSFALVVDFLCLLFLCVVL